jgi:hypothetical protein
MISRKDSAFILIAGLLWSAAGCSQPLRTLMGIGAEQKAQQQYQQRQETLFYRLVKDVESGRLKQGADREDVLRRYGDPIVLNDGTIVYQRPGDYFRATKVYMVFDDDDKLRTLRVQEASV